jgi:hypothetical protein
MEVIVNCAEWLSPNEVQHSATLQVSDNTSMEELESICQQNLSDKSLKVKDGLLTYNRNVKPDYNKKSLALWVLQEEPLYPISYLYSKHLFF